MSWNILGIGSLMDTLWVILSGMLGIAGLRSFDKLKGTQTPHVGGKK